MASFMWLEEEDILESSLLVFMDDKPVASPTPTEEAALLEDDSGPQEAWATIPEPECWAGLEETVVYPQDMQDHPPPPPLGFEL